jgi:hypothetical protein
MTVRCLIGLTIALSSFFGLGSAHAECLLGQSTRRELITTSAGHTVELFDDFLRVDGVIVGPCTGLPAVQPTAIATHAGSYVVGFRDHGLFMASNGGYVSLPFNHGAVRALASIGDILYVASSEPGLWRLQDGKVSPVRLAAIARRRIGALASSGAQLHIGLEPSGHLRWSGTGRATRVSKDELVGCFRQREPDSLVALPPGAACRTGPIAGDLPSAHITSLAQFHDELFVGTFDHGLFVLSHGRIARSHDEPRFVNALLASADELYVASATGLYRAHVAPDQPLSFARIPLPPEHRHVNDLARAADGTLWLATGNGLLGLSSAGTRVLDVSAGLPSRLVYAVAFADDGALWAGTARGAVRMDGSSVRTYSTRDGALAQDWVTALFFHEGRMLAGTYDAGLFALSADGSAARVSESEHWWVNPRGISAFAGQLYVATMGAGLQRSGQALAGLPDSDVTAVSVHDGELWVGTRHGLARIKKLRD